MYRTKLTKDTVLKLFEKSPKVIQQVFKNNKKESKKAKNWFKSIQKRVKKGE